jgi:hypothetical protein
MTATISSSTRALLESKREPALPVGARGESRSAMETWQALAQRWASPPQVTAAARQFPGAPWIPEVEPSAQGLEQLQRTGVDATLGSIDCCGSSAGGCGGGAGSTIGSSSTTADAAEDSIGGVTSLTASRTLCGADSTDGLSSTGASGGALGSTSGGDFLHLCQRRRFGAQFDSWRFRLRDLGAWLFRQRCELAALC